MDWIKKNYEKAMLGAFALVLLAMSALLILRALSFQETFANIRGEVARNTKIETLEMATIDEAKAALQKPAGWIPQKGSGSLFVSRKYIVKQEKLIDPLEEGSEMLHPPVPNEWLTDHNLDILDTEILTRDPDGDGFTVLDEYRGKSDPNEKNSRPAYISKLQLEKFIAQPFVILFASYDGDESKPDEMTFQINAITAGKPSQFLKLGEMIAGTKFKVLKFEKKTQVDPNGVEKDLSQLTIQHTETNESLTLVLGKLANSPDSYALFKYLWNNDSIKVKKDKNFVLKPDNEEYKLIDISDAGAVVKNLKTNEEIKIPRLETAP